MSAILNMILALMISFTACEKDETTTETEHGNGTNTILPDISGYPIVGTNQTTSFDNSTTIAQPAAGDDFYGQNSNYPGTAPEYVDNGDGTVTDMVTGLMWQQSFDHNDDGEINYDDNLTYNELIALVEDGVTFAGYDDWRLPTIKEMYSLILFSGRDISPEGTSTAGLIPFIDNQTFKFAYGDLDAGERLIDMQCATTNVYVSNEVPQTVFGVNFADGRIKGYGTSMPGGENKKFDYLLVRGNTSYGVNIFSDNGDGTIIDQATGLMWMQDDSGEGMLWQDALAYAEGKVFAGYSDWRLPNTKELQSIVDYSRSPATTNSAAIDPLFNCTQIANEAGEADYAWYWSSTTHARMENAGGSGGSAAYVCFGRSLGYMNNNWIDIHGVGAQRSDTKSGDLSQYTQQDNGYYNSGAPQGDAIRTYNYVRLVRNID